MFVSQLSVFIENTPGALARVTKLLADNKVDIRAMSLAEMPDFGVLRLIVDDNATAGKVLKENNFIYRFTDVIAISVSDEPGGLSSALALLSDDGVNISYMYAFIAVSGHTAAVVIRVPDADRDRVAQKLTAGGAHLLSDEEAAKI